MFLGEGFVDEVSAGTRIDEECTRDAVDGDVDN
jgi:hypothetical protein